MPKKVQILSHNDIQARIKRIAYEIYESNYQEEEIVVIGIDERGGFMAKELCKRLSEISSLKVTRISADLDRTNPRGSSIGIQLNIDLDDLKDVPILVVDDVIYSGSTLLNVVSILLQVPPKSIQTAILVDRGHRQFPVSADFVGIELATTLQQHVSLEIIHGKAQVFLL